MSGDFETRIREVERLLGLDGQPTEAGIREAWAQLRTAENPVGPSADFARYTRQFLIEAELTVGGYARPLEEILEQAEVEYGRLNNAERDEIARVHRSMRDEAIERYGTSAETGGLTS
jgi:hypothetical protein